MKQLSRASLVLLLVIAACGSTDGVGRTPAPERDRISRAEIDASSAANAYDLVQSLRPQWLTVRGIRTMDEMVGQNPILVYMDNARLGGPDALRNVPHGSVRYLRFFNAAEATQRWGGGHLHGAILISTQDG